MADAKHATNRGPAPRGETSSDAPKAGAQAIPAEATITFHCPNGHRITIAARLAGKRGACSKCGVDVVIPAGVPAAVPPAALAPAASAPPPAPAAVVVPAVAPVPSPPDESVALGALFDAIGGGAAAVTRGEESNTITMHSAPREWQSPGADEPSNATARLVARLWAEREHGGIVELHVTGGSVILPEWYEARWSSGSHGLFASQAADGSVTLTAVAWDSIQKIVVRQVEGLPDGMFE